MAVGHQSFIVLSKVWVWCANGLLCNCHSQDTQSVLTGNNCRRYLFELEMFNQLLWHGHKLDWLLRFVTEINFKNKLNNISSRSYQSDNNTTSMKKF